FRNEKDRSTRRSLSAPSRSVDTPATVDTAATRYGARGGAADLDDVGSTEPRPHRIALSTPSQPPPEWGLDSPIVIHHSTLVLIGTSIERPHRGACFPPLEFPKASIDTVMTLSTGAATAPLARSATHSATEGRFLGLQEITAVPAARNESRERRCASPSHSRVGSPSGATGNGPPRIRRAARAEFRCPAPSDPALGHPDSVRRT